MGGKTQQRVAGNVKPTNSGRIRELLINQQQGATGNIITFSALAKAPKPAKPEPERPKTPQEESVKAHPSPTIESDSQHQRDNCKLVVRKVGNRDLYTRVKLADNEQDNNDIESAVLPSDAGVKKPSLPSVGSFENANRMCELESENNDISNASIVEKVEEEPPEEKYDFDTVLEKLSKAQELITQTSADSLTELTEELIEQESDMLKLFRVMTKKFNRDLSIEDWDIIVTSIHKWVNWISKSEHPLREAFHIKFCANVFDFVHQLISFAENLSKDEKSLEEFPMMQSLLDDWSNFRSSILLQEIIILYFKLISMEGSSDNEEANRPILEALANIVIGVDPRVVLSHNSLLDYLGAKVEFDPDFKASSNSIYCGMDVKKFKGFIAVCGLLKSNLRVTLVSAHAMLLKTMPSICQDVSTSALIAEPEAVDDILIFPPAALTSILTSRDSIISALLSDYRVGDISVTIDPNTDSYACTLAYLFAWDLAIQFIVGIDKEVGHRIIYSLKKLGFIRRLLDNIFILLPPLGERNSLALRIESDYGSSTSTRDRLCTLKEFLKSPLQTTVRRPINEIELVALHLYFSVASHMPVTVRKWYNNNSNKRLCNLVHEYTVKHISQVICSLEMESVQEKCQERASKEESKNLVIKARPSAKEVYAIYTRDEFKMELTIKLPMNYPLGPVQIDGGKRVGVTDVKWRSWLLQLTTFLAHQNGPILDGIDLWRRNIDKRFEGIEKCTICFSILHSNYQLPKKKCQTCANMFHNLCLYKWFESSGNSTCPLCRNAW